jgi:hypothetical protein
MRFDCNPLFMAQRILRRRLHDYWVTGRIIIARTWCLVNIFAAKTLQSVLWSLVSNFLFNYMGSRSGGWRDILLLVWSFLGSHLPLSCFWLDKFVTLIRIILTYARCITVYSQLSVTFLLANWPLGSILFNVSIFGIVLRWTWSINTCFRPQVWSTTGHRISRNTIAKVRFQIILAWTWWSSSKSFGSLGFSETKSLRV